MSISAVARTGIRVGDVRAQWFAPALVAASLLTFVGVLLLTSYRNFFYDEWSFIVSRRAWEPLVMMLPHNSIHWSAIPILVWKLLFVVVGIRSHVPYEAALLVVHVTAVALLFALIRRRSGDLPAFAAALILLVLGSGADDIVWAFQLAWVGSVAFGLLAMLLLDGNPPFPSRVFGASVALLGSLMCSSVGLVFLAAVGVELAVDPRRRRFLLALVVPAGTFVAWFSVFNTGLVPGSGQVSGDILHGATGWPYVGSVAKFVVTGLQACAAGITGLTGIGAVALPVLAAILGWRWYMQAATPSWQTGLIAGLLSWFPLIAIGRVQLGIDQATQTRYVYVGVVFLLPLVAHAARDLPWRGVWRPALTVAFAFALLGNITQLRDQALVLVDFMRLESAALQTVEVFRSAPDLARHRYVDDGLLPQVQVGDYLDATHELGSPVPSATVGTLQELPAPVVDRVMLNLFGDALTVKADSTRSLAGLPCHSVDSSAGATIDLQVEDSQAIMLQSIAGGDVYLSLWYRSGPPSQPLNHVQLQPATPEWVHLPNTGQSIVWQMQINASAIGLMNVCGTDRLQILRSNNVYRTQADTFTYGTGWSTVADSAATDRNSAKANRGTRPASGAFGGEFVPAPRAYDVWYRLRVSDPSSSSPQILLTLTDVTASTYIATTTLSAKQASTAYSWVRVAANLTPTTGHSVRFQINVVATLTTDWYIDTAVMVPAGSSVPGA